VSYSDLNLESLKYSTVGLSDCRKLRRCLDIDFQKILSRKLEEKEKTPYFGQLALYQLVPTIEGAFKI